MSDTNYFDQSSAPFNMAISTLMRIDRVLVKITDVSSDFTLPTNIKQSIKVNLVKQLFVQATPLLKSNIVKDFKEVIDKLKANEFDVALGKGGMTRKMEKRTVFDPKLELILDTLTIEIQQELQKEKYFMPPRRDLSRAVADMQ